jgi:hypothetical protein
MSFFILIATFAVFSMPASEHSDLQVSFANKEIRYQRLTPPDIIFQKSAKLTGWRGGRGND